MLGHVAYQNLFGFVATQTKLFEGSVASAQHLLRRQPELGEHRAQLGLRQRVLSILSVLELEPVLLEQGDRPAASASRTSADQLDHSDSPLLLAYLDW